MIQLHSFIWLSNILVCVCVCVCVCVSVYHIFFIHSSVDVHLGCFHVLLFVNSAAMKIGCLCLFELWFSLGLGLLDGEGNGTPLQYFCLENPMDGGAW